MRFIKIAFAGVVFFFSQQNVAFAAELPFTVTSGYLERSYSTADEHRLVEAKVKVDGIKKLLKAYGECGAKGNFAVLSIPSKSVSCQLNENRPRGKHLGSCIFTGSVLCLTREMLTQGEEARLGSEVTDLISGRQAIEMPDGSKADFSEFRDKLGR